MNETLNIQGGVLADLIRPKQGIMLISWKVGVALFFLWAVVTQDRSRETFWLGAALSLLCFFPAYLYCRKGIPGLPIFPLFAFTHLWAFALPLLSNEERLTQYPIGNVELAALTVAVYLMIGTWIYHLTSRRRAKRINQVLVLRESSSSVLWVPLLIALGFTISQFYGAGDRFGPLFPVLQAAMLAVQSLAIFVLAFRYGNNRMGAVEKIAFLIVFCGLILIQAAGLLLVNPMTIFLVATVAFTIARGRLPWISVLIFLAFFTVLHAGKSKMRAKYWEDDAEHVSLVGLPGFFTEWFGYSLENGISGLFQVAEVDDASQSLLQRSSLLHLLVLEEFVCPDTIDYMGGATYSIIPELLVPRFMNSEKIWSHEGTYLLNIHFGIQTADQTLSTTVGWGLLNEAFANFGFVGVAALAVLLGGGYGFVERWTAFAPLLSMRVFVGILILTAAFQTEYSAGVFVSSLFQGICALAVLSFALMERRSLVAHSIPSLYRPGIKPVLSSSGV